MFFTRWIVSRPLTWEPVHERRVATTERTSGPTIKSLIGAEE